MWYHMLFCSVPSTFKCTTLTPLYEVRSNCSFFSPLASCPLPRTQWRHLHFHKKWQQHFASWNNVRLYLQETTVGGLLFGISVSFCYFSRPFAKEKKKKKNTVLCISISSSTRGSQNAGQTSFDCRPGCWQADMAFWALWSKCSCAFSWDHREVEVAQACRWCLGCSPAKHKAWSKEEGEEDRQGLWPAWRPRISRSTASNRICVHS